LLVPQRRAPGVEVLDRILRPELLVDRLPLSVGLDARVRGPVLGPLVLTAERERRPLGNLQRRSPDHPLLEIRRGKAVLLLLLALSQEQQDDQRVPHFPSLTQVSLNATQPIFYPKI